MRAVDEKLIITKLGPNALIHIFVKTYYKFIWSKKANW